MRYQCLLYIFFSTTPVEVPGLRVKKELKLPAYATDTATWNPSHNYNLHHCSWQCQILTAEPQWECLNMYFKIDHISC